MNCSKLLCGIQYVINKYSGHDNYYVGFVNVLRVLFEGVCILKRYCLQTRG